MNTGYRTMAGIAIGFSIGIASTGLEAAQAVSLTYDMTFFQGTTVAGTGRFTYDPDATLEFPYQSAQGNKIGQLPGLLRGFSAELFGIALIPNERVGFGVDPILGLQGIYGRRKPITRLLENRWFFNLNYSTTTINLTGKQTQPDMFAGTWDLRKNLVGQGEWTATLKGGSEAVPEPTTMLGATVFGVGCLLRKKLARAKS